MPKNRQRCLASHRDDQLANWHADQGRTGAAQLVRARVARDTASRLERHPACVEPRDSSRSERSGRAYVPPATVAERPCSSCIMAPLELWTASTLAGGVRMRVP